MATRCAAASRRRGPVRGARRGVGRRHCADGRVAAIRAGRYGPLARGSPAAQIELELAERRPPSPSAQRPSPSAPRPRWPASTCTAASSTRCFSRRRGPPLLRPTLARRRANVGPGPSRAPANADAPRPRRSTCRGSPGEHPVEQSDQSERHRAEAHAAGDDAHLDVSTSISPRRARRVVLTRSSTCFASAARIVYPRVPAPRTRSARNLAASDSRRARSPGSKAPRTRPQRSRSSVT